MSREYTRVFTSHGLLPIAGSILFYNSFEDHLRFTELGTGGDTVFEIDPSLSFHGTRSLYMKTRTTSAVEDDYIVARNSSHLLPSLRCHFTIRFRCPDFSKYKTLEFALFFFDDTDLHDARIAFTPATPKWQYYGTAPGFVDIAGSGVNLAVDSWHAATLIVDFLNDVYVSFQIDHLFFDLSNLAIPTATNPTDSFLASQTQITTVGASPAEINIDSHTLTES